MTQCFGVEEIQALLASFNGGPVLFARTPEANHWHRNIDAETPMLPCMVCLIVAYIYTDMTLLFLHLSRIYVIDNSGKI